MNSVEIIVVSGCLSGVVDILTTMVVMSAQGMTPERLLQFISSGVLGEQAFEGGKRTAAIGLLFHFLIALVASTLYYAASSVLPVLPLHPVIFGILFGVAVQLFMSGVIVPLSRTPKVEFSIKGFLTQLFVQIFCVGLAIALVQSFLLLQFPHMQLWSLIAG